MLRQVGAHSEESQYPANVQSPVQTQRHVTLASSGFCMKRPILRRAKFTFRRGFIVFTRSLIIDRSGRDAKQAISQTSLIRPVLSSRGQKAPAQSPESATAWTQSDINLKCAAVSSAIEVRVANFTLCSEASFGSAGHWPVSSSYKMVRISRSRCN